MSLPPSLSSHLKSAGLTPKQIENLSLSYSTPPLTSFLRLNQTETLCKVQESLPDFVCYQHPIFPDVVCVERKRPSQLQPLQPPASASSKTAKIVITDARCGENVLRGADIYSPGVIAASDDVLPGDIVSVYVSHERINVGTRVSALNVDKMMAIAKGTATKSRSEMMRDRTGVAVTEIR